MPHPYDPNPAPWVPDAYIVAGPYAWAVLDTGTHPTLVHFPLNDGVPDWANPTPARDLTWEGTPLEHDLSTRSAWIAAVTGQLGAIGRNLAILTRR